MFGSTVVQTVFCLKKQLLSHNSCSKSLQHDQCNSEQLRATQSNSRNKRNNKKTSQTQSTLQANSEHTQRALAERTCVHRTSFFQRRVEFITCCIKSTWSELPMPMNAHSWLPCSDSPCVIISSRFNLQPSPYKYMQGGGQKKRFSLP